MFIDDTEVARLEELRNVLHNRRGGWLAGVGAFSYGRDILRDMLPNKTYFHLLILNVTGELPEDRFCKWLEAIYMCLSWPEPRVWCNAIGALSGTSRATAIAGTAAGVLATDSTMYGPGSLFEAVKFIGALSKVTPATFESRVDYINSKISEAGGRVHITGYARPIAIGDERVAVMLDYAEELGFDRGEHMRIALEVEDYLFKHHGESLNLAGYIAAFYLDYLSEHVSVDKMYALLVNLASSGITACHVEEADKPHGSFLPQRCDDIEYTGPAARPLPERYR